MDWKTLFFTADGRIGRSSFWIAWLVLLGVNVVLGWIPLLGWFLSLATIYCFVCIYAKRLHDMGKSGWLQIVPMLITFALPVVGLFAFGGMAIGAGLADQGEAATAATVLGGLGGFLITLCLAFVVGLGFLIWVGASNGQSGDNKYGPPPLPAAV